MQSFLSLILLPLLSLNLAAQNGQLYGTVTINQEMAIGAHLSISSLGLETVANIDGTYRITDISYGDYTITVSFVGAQPYSQIISIGQLAVELNIELEAANNTLGEVTISAKSEARQQQEQAIHIESVNIQNLTNEIVQVTDALDQLAGVRVRSSGSMGTATDISLNGLNGTAIRSYLDGLPLEFVYPGLDISSFPLTNIKRVDIYKGVIPVNIGTDAMGGGINIISDYKPYNSIHASYGFGSFNTHQASVNGNWAFSDDLILNVNTSYNYSDNNFSMLAYVWEEREKQKVERFNDQFNMLFTDASLVIKNKKWADFLRLNVSYSNYDKEVQNGNFIGRTALGEIKYQGINKNVLCKPLRLC